MTNINSQKQIIEQLELFISPIIRATQDEESLFKLFKALGWDIRNSSIFPISDIQLAVSSISAVAQEVIELINNPPTTLLDLAEALQKSSDLFEALNNIQDFVNSSGASNMPQTLKTHLETLAKDILDLLTFGYLVEKAPKLYLALVTLGLIDDYRLKGGNLAFIHPTDEWTRYTTNYSSINYTKINALFADPIQYLKNEFLPSSHVIDTEEEAKEFSDNLFPRLRYLFEELGFNTAYGMNPENASITDPAVFSRMNRTFTISKKINNFNIGASFLYLPNNNSSSGLVVTPFGDWSFAINSKKWLLYGTAVGNPQGFTINQSGFTFPSSFSGDRFQLMVSTRPNFEDGKKTYNLGSTTGSRIEIENIVFHVYTDLIPNNIEFGARLVIERLTLVIGGGEGDGFLNKIFTEPVKVDFDLLAGWSNQFGFFFQGSGSLKIAIPVHKEFYGIKLEVVYVDITFKNGEISAQLSADSGLEIGPFSASINRMGLESLISLERGNLGPIDASLKFKPPSGVGFTIDASAIKGGGFLSFDFEEERYVGALELSIKDKVALKVIGILTTKLPGNDDGYSLLLLITAEFEPLNLGFGFTLNGVGGIIALNRTINMNYLRDGIKANTLDNILFPTDPIQNIGQIISDLEGAFPIQEGRYAFGPMAIIGWGTPTLMTVELGLMIEVPSPVRIAVLGVLKAILPTEEKSLLKIQVNFLGTIDFEAKYITFDASIFESKLLTFTLEGDMAFRLKWGDNPNFLFSIGGFHPSYTPPPLDLPSLKRLTINLLGGDNPRLTLTSYFAITSNTVQFGSLVDFYFKITEKYSVIGYLGFDILIQFNPFYLIASIAAQLAVMKNEEAVLSIYLGASVSGPAPWHVQGTAEFEVFGITLKVSFDKTFGQPETTTLPNVDVLPRLVEAIENKANWQARNSSSSNLLVTLRELNNAPGDVVAHPFGSIGVSQKVVPLDLTINKFGTQRPADYQNFSLDIANGAGVNLPEENIKDFFAPAEYLELSDSSKLSRKSFEEFNSGVTIKGGDELKSSYLMELELEYEQVILDSRRMPDRIGKIKESSLRFNSFRKNGTAAKSKLGTKSKPKSENAPPKVSVRQEKFAIANVDDLSQYGAMEAGSEAEARVMLEKLLNGNPALTDKVQVVPFYEIA